MREKHCSAGLVNSNLRGEAAGWLVWFKPEKNNLTHLAQQVCSLKSPVCFISLTSRRQEFATNQLSHPQFFSLFLAKQANNLQYFLVVTRSLEVEITELDHYQQKHLSISRFFIGATSYVRRSSIKSEKTEMWWRYESKVNRVVIFWICHMIPVKGLGELDGWSIPKAVGIRSTCVAGKGQKRSAPAWLAHYYNLTHMFLKETFVLFTALWLDASQINASWLPRIVISIAR